MHTWLTSIKSAKNNKFHWPTRKDRNVIGAKRRLFNWFWLELISLLIYLIWDCDIFYRMGDGLFWGRTLNRLPFPKTKFKPNFNRPIWKGLTFEKTFNDETIFLRDFIEFKNVISWSLDSWRVFSNFCWKAKFELLLESNETIHWFPRQVMMTRFLNFTGWFR